MRDMISRCEFNAGLADITEEIKAAGGKCYPYYCDITNKEEVYRVAKAVQIEVGNVSEKLQKSHDHEDDSRLFKRKK